VEPRFVRWNVGSTWYGSFLRSFFPFRSDHRGLVAFFSRWDPSLPPPPLLLIGDPDNHSLGWSVDCQKNAPACFLPGTPHLLSFSFLEPMTRLSPSDVHFSRSLQPPASEETCPGFLLPIWALVFHPALLKKFCHLPWPFQSWIPQFSPVFNFSLLLDSWLSPPGDCPPGPATPGLSILSKVNISFPFPFLASPSLSLWLGPVSPFVVSNWVLARFLGNQSFFLSFRFPRADNSAPPPPDPSPKVHPSQTGPLLLKRVGYSNFFLPPSSSAIRRDMRELFLV